MSQAFVNQRMRVAQRPTVLVHPSEEEEEEEEPTLPMDGYDYDEDDEEEEQEEEEEDEEEEEEEEEQEEDEEEERERGTLLLRVSNPMARKSVALKAPRKTAMKSSSYRASPSPQKQRQQKQKDDAEKRQKKKKKKKKKRPRDPYDVAKENFDNEGDRIEAINAKFRREIARRSQPQYKEGIIKPAGDKPGKIVSVFRDRPDKASFIATDEDLKRVLRVEQEELVVFDIVLRRGQHTKVVNTLKTIHFTGYVVGDDPDPYPMGGAMPSGGSQDNDRRYPNNDFAMAMVSFDNETSARLKVRDLRFRLEVNGIHWDNHGAIEEVFYFLINKSSKDPSAKKKRRGNLRRGAGAGNQVVVDPLREAFDKEIEAEKADITDEATWPGKYNYCRDVTIMQLGHYMSFLHARLDEQMGPREAPIPMDIIKGWLSTKLWNHIY